MKHFSRFSINLLTKELDKLQNQLFLHTALLNFIVNIVLNKN
jgi:hypothetical protein